MSTEEADPVQTLTQLSTQLQAFKSALEPLLKTPFQEQVQDADPLNKARLEVMTAYMVHDLIWMYLKTTAVDPATHPVSQELERLKGYFTKLKVAEGSTSADNSTSSMPSIAGSEEPSRMKIDKDAASRFINAAISSQKASVDPSYSNGDAVAGPSSTHIRFDGEPTKTEMDKKVEELLESDDDDDDDESEESEEEIKAAKEDKPKPNRPRMDPFAGYDSPKPKPNSATTKPKSTSAKHSRPTEATITTTGDGLSKSQRKRLRLKEQKAVGQ